MQLDQLIGCWEAMVAICWSTSACFFFSDTLGPLFRSVLNWREEKHRLAQDAAGWPGYFLSRH